MKNKLLLLIVWLILFVCMPLAGTEKMGVPAEGKTIYGYRIFDADAPYTRGPAYFNINNPKDITLIYADEETLRCSSAGAYLDGFMYCYIYGFDKTWMSIVPYGFCKIDLTTGDQIKLADYSQMIYLFADMTYDVTTGEMYYIADSSEGSILGKVNLANGETTMVAEIASRLMTLACNMYGQMYVITFDGKLAKLDKKSGELSVVGNTGRMPLLNQSMDFDRDTNILYWSTTDGVKTEFLKVNTSTGEVTSVGPLGNTSQITSLCIPYTPVPAKCPDMVTDISIESAQAGALKATISFKAPVKTLSGVTLASISKIEVFRNAVSVKTIDNPVPGKTQRFEDAVTEKGIYHYKIVASNAEGNGIPVFVDSFIGEDVPGAPSEIVLSRDGENASLSWIAPAKGLNGGWIDVSTLTYKVTRLPDLVEYDRVTGNNLKKEMGEYNLYSYKIQAVTRAGEGGTSLSNAIKMGSPFAIPFKCPFKKEDEFKLWNVINQNEDEQTWIFKPEMSMVTYVGSELNSADDWLISPPMKLEAGITYRIRFDVRESFADKTECLKVYLGEENQVKDMTKELGSYEIKNIDFETKTITLVAEHTGTYHLGLYACSQADQWWICIQNLIVEQLYEKDLSSINISGQVLPISGKKQEYKVTVLNNGSLVQNSYKVELTDEKGTVLAEKAVTTAIAPDQMKEIGIEYIPTSAGIRKIKGRVVLSQDSYASNNETDYLQLDVQQAGDEWLIIGRKNITGVAMPINFNAKTSTVQTIYTKENLKCGDGFIKGMAYPYSNTSDAEVQATVQVYLANTDLSDLKEDWIPADQFTLVYNKVISVPPGESYLNITFDAPFKYNSAQNLGVMTNKPMVEEYVYGIQSPWTEASEASSRVYGNDFLEFMYAVEQPGSLLAYVPDVMIKMNFDTNAVSGQKITDSPVCLDRKTGMLTVTGDYDSLRIYDTKGQVVMRVNSTPEINLNGVTSGIYVVKVYRGNQAVQVCKIAK